jgi:hypothetical protein
MPRLFSWLLTALSKVVTKVVGLDQTHRNALAGAQVQTSAEVGGKDRARVLGRWICRLDEASAGVRPADERLAEGLRRRVSIRLAVWLDPRPEERGSIRTWRNRP